MIKRPLKIIRTYQGECLLTVIVMVTIFSFMTLFGHGLSDATLSNEAPSGLIPIFKPECITRQDCEKPYIICPTPRISCPQKVDKIGNHIIPDRGIINPALTEPCQQDTLSSQGDTQIRGY